LTALHWLFQRRDAKLLMIERFLVIAAISHLERSAMAPEVTVSVYHCRYRRGHAEDGSFPLIVSALLAI
jgi:hypothetical protein